MIELTNEPLYKHTTVRLGGIARSYRIPESLEELCTLVKEEHPKYYIGGGSNLLIADREFDLVVDLHRFNNELTHLGKGRFRAGASVRLQELINGINQAGYGGIEYLYSVPGLVGGAIVMNAGRGKNYHRTISDYIVSVDVLRGGKTVTLTRSECAFSHRSSCFKNSTDIVLGCLFDFPGMTQEETASLKKERLELCKKKQDTSRPNFGSVFCEKNDRIMRYVQKHETGGKVHFSKKTPNWIINDGGSFKEAVGAIKKVELMHRLLFRKCVREVVVWE